MSAAASLVFLAAGIVAALSLAGSVKAWRAAWRALLDERAGNDL